MPRSLRRCLALIHAAVPEEGPAEHIRHAPAFRVAHENAHPTIWTFSPELRECESRIFKALLQIEGAPHDRPLDRGALAFGF